MPSAVWPVTWMVELVDGPTVAAMSRIAFTRSSVAVAPGADAGITVMAA